jgi:hypothetical protein
LADFQVQNTVAEEWTYRAHPKDSLGQDVVSGVALVATVVSGDGSVVQNPVAPFDVRILSGPAIGGITVFQIALVGNVVPGILPDTVTMTQLAVPPPPPGPAATSGAELIGPNPQ